MASSPRLGSRSFGVRCRAGAGKRSCIGARAVPSRGVISICAAWSSGGLSTTRDHFARPVRACGGLLKDGTPASSIVRFRLGWGCRPQIGSRFRVIPKDPRAVSDPRLILDEFPDLVGDRQIGRDKGAFPVGADCWRRLPAEVKAAPRDGGSSPRWRPPGAKVLVWSSPMANKYEHPSRVQAGRLPVFCRQNQAYGFWDWSLSSDRLAA